ncbi:MAG: RagB/SusD family nutrient uptake outer membrane protein [Bacteroidales bacterium]
MRNIYKTSLKTLAIMIAFAAFSSCEKYLEIPLPTNSLSTSSAFKSKSVIDGLMNQLYITFVDNVAIPVTGTRTAEAMCDNAFNPTATFLVEHQTNNITSASTLFLTWSSVYRSVYMANTMIEGLPDANAVGLTTAVKDSYIAAALTIRAMAYFQLVRCWGDVPLILTTDVEANKTLGRTPKAEVYVQIETDLKKAMTLLTTTIGSRYYINNKFIPEAILANVYLTQGKWTEAEAAATNIITSGKFQLVNVADVFLQTSAETIMATGYTYYANDKVLKAAFPGAYVLLPAGSNRIFLEGTTASLSESLLNSFESGDLRRTNWTITSNAGGYSNPLNRVYTNKYKYNPNLDPAVIIPAGREEDMKFIRLAEIYLIRAESRASKASPDLTGAAADLNAVRIRAGLVNTTATTQTTLVDAILKERRVELFYENFTRWFDLIRTNKADAVYAAIPYKAANWKPHMKLFPIPVAELNYNTNLTPNPGY